MYYFVTDPDRNPDPGRNKLVTVPDPDPGLTLIRIRIQGNDKDSTDMDLDPPHWFIVYVHVLLSIRHILHASLFFLVRRKMSSAASFMFTRIPQTPRNWGPSWRRMRWWQTWCRRWQRKCWNLSTCWRRWLFCFNDVKFFDLYLVGDCYSVFPFNYFRQLCLCVLCLQQKGLVR